MLSNNLIQQAYDFLNNVISSSKEEGISEGKTTGYNEGKAAGYNEGKTAGYTEGKTAGYSEGKTAGYAEGKAAGYNEGFSAGTAIGNNAGYNEGKTDGYAEGKTAGIAEGKVAGYAEGKAAGIIEGKEIGIAEGFNDGYNKGYAEGFENGKNEQQVTPVIPDPSVNPEPIEVDPDTPVTPEPEPVEPEPEVPATYNAEKLKTDLLALKELKAKSCVFAIADVTGKLYYDKTEYTEAGKPEVLGIAYTDGEKFLCMHPKKLASHIFGGAGIKFNSKVYTTTKQWRNSANNIIPAFDDYTGVSNTEGIIEGCDDSVAAICKQVIFANGQSGYMPAQAEMRVFCKYFSRVDELLGIIGGDKLKIQSGAQLLWSSTCADAKYAWCVRYMTDGDAQPMKKLKSEKAPCRVYMKI